MNLSSFFETISKLKHLQPYGCVLLLLFASSCVGTKFLEPGEKILVKQEIEGVNSDTQDRMASLFDQEPNSRFLVPGGPAHLVYIYEFGKKHMDTVKILQKKDKIIEKFDKKIASTDKAKKIDRLTRRKQQKLDKINKVMKEGNQLMRWGEPLAVYDSSSAYEAVEKISGFMDSYGYFTNKVSLTETIKGKDSLRVSLKYDVERGYHYKCDSIEYIIKDPKVEALFQKNMGNVNLKGKPLTQWRLSEERDRVYNMMVNNGYYGFSKDYVVFEIDSTMLGSKKLFVREIILNPQEKAAHAKYQLDSIVFVTDAGLEVKKGYSDQEYNDITYTFGRFQYSTKILNWHNQLYPGQTYRRSDVLETQRQLSYLDNFKFINVNFDSLDGKFVGYIFTSPSDRFSTSTEVGMSVTQGLPGPFANLNIKNRNLFNGLEVTQLNTNFKLEGLGGVSSRANTYSSLQYGAELSITFPQFLSPLGRFYKKKIAQFNPKTRFSLSFGHEDRFNEYQRTTFNTNIAYLWKVKDHISYTLTPMELSYIESDTEPAFQDFLDNLSVGGNSYANTFRSSFVSSGSFQAIINDNYGTNTSASYFQLFFESGGNLLSLFSEEPFGSQLEYFQFVKTNIDIRKNFYIHRRQSIVTRFNIGIGVPYGDNRSLPYEKYFFAGGSNSIRAWKPRRLGPGAYGIINPDGSVNYDREQPGDVLIQSSVELRQSFDGFIDLALFADFGNTWLLNSETVDPSLDPQGDDGVFRFNNFLNQMAVGVGYGFRFDLSFLIFRLDIGYQLIDPAQPRGQRWVGDQYNFFISSDKFPWFGFRPFKNAAINIGIGYPF